MRFCDLAEFDHNWVTVSWIRRESSHLDRAHQLGQFCSIIVVKQEILNPLGDTPSSMILSLDPSYSGGSGRSETADIVKGKNGRVK